MIGSSSKHRLSKFFPGLFLLADILVLNFAFILSQRQFFGDYYTGEDQVFLQVGLNSIWFLIFISFKLYEMNRDVSLIIDLNRVLLAVIVLLSIVFAWFFFSTSPVYSREQLFNCFLFFTGGISLWRIIWHYFIQYWRSRGYNIRNFVVFGSGSISTELISHFRENLGVGYRFLNSYNHATRDVFKELNGYSSPNQIDVIFCNIQALGENEVKELVDFAENNLIKIKLVSQFIRLGGREISIQQYGDIPVIDVNFIPLDNALNRFIKRTFDVIFSTFVIVFMLSWLFPLLAIVIRINSKGPILFKQLRDGKDGSRFVCLKFRTMVINPDSDEKQATRDDSRITTIGSILRRTSLDELPQFINVFLGDMSVVGPRPHPVKLNEQYQPVIDRFVQRHAVKPGITGLAQARGFRGETAHISEMVSRVKLDRFYIKNWSMVLDFKIIVLTVLSIIKGSEKAF